MLIAAQTILVLGKFDKNIWIHTEISRCFIEDLVFDCIKVQYKKKKISLENENDV